MMPLAKLQRGLVSLLMYLYCYSMQLISTMTIALILHDTSSSAWGEKHSYEKN